MQNRQQLILIEQELEHHNPDLLVLERNGRFDKEHITLIMSAIESKAKQLEYNLSFITKLKLVTVEILQNISKHRVEIPDKPPYFIAAFKTSGVIIFSGNTVNKKSMHIVDDRLKIYIGLQSTVLKDFYRDSLKHTAISEAGNAGIGLLDIVYRCNQQIEYAFEACENDLYHFELKANLHTHGKKKN